jgi:hypothetical protein
MGGQNADPEEKHDPVKNMRNRRRGNKKKALDGNVTIREVYLIQSAVNFLNSEISEGIK